jgi:hypothetical protein
MAANTGRTMKGDPRPGDFQKTEFQIFSAATL